MRGRLPFALLSAALLSSTVARAESSGFTLETGSPDALCPELEVTRELVTRRLGSLVVEGRRGWRARYTIGHAPSGYPRDFVRLELFGPEGAVEMLRDLPIEGDSCRTMAEVIALVLDRYFRGLGAEEQRPEDPAPAPPAAAPATPPPAPSPERPQLRLPLARRLSLEYAVSYPPGESWVGLRGSTTLGSSLEVALGLRWGLTPLGEQAPRGVTVEARTAVARSSVAWRLALPPGVFHIGPSVSLAVQHATTLGLATRTDRTRVIWSAGAEAGFVAPLGPRVFLEAGISADFLASSGRFFIQDSEVLSPRWLTLGGSLGVGYAWAP